MLNPTDKVSAWRNEVPSLVDPCHLHNLNLNISKTKELVGDFYSNRGALLSLTITGVKLERVDSFKFLGAMISSTLKWDDNLVCIIKKIPPEAIFLVPTQKTWSFWRGVAAFPQSCHTKCAYLSYICVVWQFCSSAEAATGKNSMYCLKKSSTVASLAYYISMLPIFSTRAWISYMTPHTLPPPYWWLPLPGKRLKSMNIKTFHFHNSTYRQDHPAT